MDKPAKAFFTRASRTDKGVSAARMVCRLGEDITCFRLIYCVCCSLKMLQEADTVDKVNALLPPDIRLQHLVRVGKNFNCQTQAEARTYLYLTPTFAFSPVTDIVTDQV